MSKRGNKTISLFEIGLLILSSFAIAFIMQENLVGAPSLADLGISPELPVDQLLYAPSKSPGGLGTASAVPPTVLPPPPGPIDANLGITKVPIDIFSTASGNFFAAHLIEGVVWGGILALGIKFLGPTFGLSEEQSNAAAIAAFGKKN